MRLGPNDRLYSGVIVLRDGTDVTGTLVLAGKLQVCSSTFVYIWNKACTIASMRFLVCRFEYVLTARHLMIGI
jgi:hypothetical protein